MNKKLLSINILAIVLLFILCSGVNAHKKGLYKASETLLKLFSI
jgi:hypothetical protein